MSEKIKILDINFDTVTFEEALSLAKKWADEQVQRYIVTPNPEILLEAQKNPHFKEILNRSSLNIADGTGILWASTYLIKTENKSKATKILKWFSTLLLALIKPKSIRKIFPERVTGTDLMQKICGTIKDKKLKIFLLGGIPGVAEKVKEELEKAHQSIKIAGTHSGNPNENEENEIINKINNSNADILFVAYGAPKQETWIARNLKKLKNIKLAIGVGGAFDFIAGTKKRAPNWMRHIGLEWLYRLIQEPSRIKRIKNALITFPITILKENLKK